MEKNKKIYTFSTSLFNIQEMNPLFSKCSAKILYTGMNQNKTFFDKESVEDCIHTLKNMPIVGEWMTDEDTFGGHGGKIEITDNDITYIPTTRPYGVVPENFTYEWESEELTDGSIRFNLIIHDIVLWTSHYEEASHITDSENSQSMEIEVEDGQWDKDLDVYKIKKFNFLSLCILGRSITPCFENSRFYSLDKEKFKKEFAQMIKELKFSLSKENQEKKEVESVIMHKELLEKYSITLEDLKDKGIVLEEFESESALEEKIKEVFESEEVITEETVEKDFVAEKDNEDTVEPIIEEITEQPTEVVEEVAEEFELTYIKQFELSHENVRSKLYEKISKDNVFGTDYFWIVEVYDDYCIVEVEDSRYCKVSYSKDNDIVSIIGESTDMFAMFLTQDEKDALEGSRVRLVELENQIKELTIFKANVEKENHEQEVDNLLKQFGLKKDELGELNILELSLIELEEKCYSALGKKLVSKKKFSADSNNSIKLNLNQDKDVEKESPYGDLFDKYNK